MKIYEKIEKIRKEKGVTKIHIANKCNKTSAWYSDISKGKIRISVDALQQIADALEVDPRIFFNNNLSVTLKDDTKQAI